MGKLKISTRLAGAFGLLVALLLMLAATSLVQLGDLRRDTEELADNWLPSVKAVSAMDAEVATLRLTTLAHIMSTDDASMAVLDKQIADETTKLADTRKRYEALISSDEERKIYNEFSAGWTKYLEVDSKALDLSRRNDKAAATAIMSGESRPM